MSSPANYRMSGANSKQFLWILLLITLLLIAIVASATTLQPMSFARLAREATAIAHVRCVGVQSLWVDGEIWTDARFAVLQQEKADAYGTDQLQSSPIPSIARATTSPSATPSAANMLTVRQLGGSIGGLHSQVDDVPVFHPGDEAYLFLWRHAGEPYRVLGWTQGTFRISRDQDTGAARVTQDSALTALHGEPRESVSSGIRNLPLATFEQRLRAALASSEH
jgi:hypothetical protein